MLLLSSCEKRVEGIAAPTTKGGSAANEDTYPTLKPTPIVIVSEETPDPYTHPTTHPKSLYEELGLEGIHGDGTTTVSFAGKVVTVADDGSLKPISKVEFFRSDDYFRSGGRELLPFTTEANGDFETHFEIFAASAHRKGGLPHDYLVYQTGTATIEAVADGFEIQRINVRFEQPSTLIILDRKQ